MLGENNVEDKLMLMDYVDNSRTDKNTVHSYLPLYQQVLKNKRYTAKNVLEIGICLGGSIKLWHDFFPSATVYGLDIMHINNVWPLLTTKERIKLYTSIDAYDYDFFKANFLDKNIKCDFIIDDGPHTLESMKQFIRFYSQLLTEDGILIIEDVQSYDWVDELTKEVPPHLTKHVVVCDLRPIKNRYDDIVFIIDRTRKIR
jgi:cephalosporin hydroxylase